VVYPDSNHHRDIQITSGQGLLGELLVRLLAQFMLDKNTYHRVHNVTLLSPDGTTQIDHVFVSRFGIFVLETKYMQRPSSLLFRPL
jgi:Nuclease-related domain